MKRSTKQSLENSTTVRFIRILMKLIQRISPGVAARLAAQLFTFPGRFRRPQHEVDLLEGTRTDRVKCGHGLVTTWTWGTGSQTVLLMHGWGGRGSQLGCLAAPFVEAGYKVVAFDAPGHGDSSGHQTNLVDFANTILALGDRHTQLCAVVAHSFGAAATTLALSRGLKVDCAVFVAPPARFDHYLDLFSGAFGLSARTLETMVKLFEHKFSVQWSDLNPVAQAPSMRLPLLAIHDRNDSEVPWIHSKDLCERWPKAELITTTGLGHRRILRDPKVILDIVAFVGQENSWPLATPIFSGVLKSDGQAASCIS